LAARVGTVGSRGLQCGGGRSLGFVGDTVGRLGGWARVWKGGAGGGEVWVLEACDGLGVRTAGSGFGLLLGRFERVWRMIEMLRRYFERLSTIEVSRHGSDRLCADGLISDGLMFRENQRVKFIAENSKVSTTNSAFKWRFRI